MRQLRILTDGRYIQDHFPGIGRYVVNLAQAMIPLLGEDERLVLLHDPTQPSRWDLTALAGERVQLVNVPISPFSLRQQWIIPRILRRLEADLYHSPYYLMPYRPGVPTVVTMYDLIPLLFPQQVSLPARLLFRWMTALALRTASHVIVISQATRRDLLAFYHLPPQKVTVIPLAIDPAFHPQPPTEIERVRRQYALPENYLLYLGINKPHKNLVRLVDAFSRLTSHVSRPTSYVQRPTLIIAGRWDKRYPDPRQWAGALGIDDAVRFLGAVPEAELHALYIGATLFVFPSLYEGFGLPVLEAMACGVPVICSNTSSLPEVAGEAAIMVNALDTDELAAAMERVLGDQALQEEMSRKGMMRVGRFSWERTARETLRVYERLSQGKDH